MAMRAQKDSKPVSTRIIWKSQGNGEDVSVFALVWWNIKRLDYIRKG
jgi:hypothetical protein